jgi:predicted membrane protein
MEVNIVFKLIGLYFQLLTAIVGWSSFLLAALLAIVLYSEKRRPFVRFLCVTYAVAFLIGRIFFAEFYFHWMSSAAIFVVAISTIFANYQDKKDGKRWWNW